MPTPPDEVDGHADETTADVHATNSAWRRRVPTQSTAVDWLIPTLVAVALLGPALRPGVIFNLDLILTPDLDTPSGFWGLGPELPRRLPLWLPISWLSSIIPATVTGKALMVAAFVVPWVGMARLTSRMSSPSRSVGRLASHAAGALYSLSPFILTRAAVGHFNVTVPHAVLPWVLPILIRPGRRPSSTFLACFAMGFAGHSGGSLAIAVVVVAIVCGRRERSFRALLVAASAQATWLVPGLAVLAANPIHMASGNAFPTAAAGLLGFARLSAGGGFWNAYFQIGSTGAVVAGCGAMLVALGIVGTRSISKEFRVPLVALGVLGWFVAAGSAIPKVDTALFWINDNVLGGVWREGHRVLTLHLLWLAPAAAVGGNSIYVWCLARRRWTLAAGPAAIMPLAIAALLAAPALWGLGGQVSAHRLPATWSLARAAIESHPGTVLALPWYQYFNLTIDDSPVRRVLNPLPLYLGGDVLSSSDNGLQKDVREYGDPRENTADALVAQLARGDQISGGLAELGVRWVMALNVIGIDDYDALAGDVGLEPVVDADGVSLYRVIAWPGAAVNVDGDPVSVSSTGPALATLDSTDSVIWARAGSDGWRRGWQEATITSSGLVGLAGGDGPVWNVATIPALLGQIVPTVVVVVVLFRRRKSG